MLTNALNLPNYISLTFIVTTFATIGFFYYAIRRSGQHSRLAVRVIAVLLAWLIIQLILGINLFYTDTSLPPRLFLFGFFPALLTMIVTFNTKKGKMFIDDLPLTTITYLNSIRIPVEFVLYWLFLAEAIPELMTFAGRNFDILAGITAPFIAYFGFKQKRLSRGVLLAWNFVSLALLFNIVVNALLSVPFPFQQFAFEQPNIAILYFPMIWLPTVVVPLVLFGHFVSIRRLLSIA